MPITLRQHARPSGQALEKRGSMAAVLNADTDGLRAAASRWQMIGGDLGASGGAPSVNLERSWPSAAATSGIHGQAAADTAAFQARIDENAGGRAHPATPCQQNER